MCDSCESLLSDVLGLGSTMIIQRGELLDAIHLLREISIYEHLICEPFAKCKAWIMDFANSFIYLNDIKSTWVETQPDDQKMFFLFLVTHSAHHIHVLELKSFVTLHWPQIFPWFIDRFEVIYGSIELVHVIEYAWLPTWWWLFD